MKICWDNLEKLRYNPKTGKWYKGTETYVYMDSCKECNEPYLMIKYQKSDFCGISCSKKNTKHSKETKNKMKGLQKGKNHPNWKGGVKKKNIPLYDTYANKIDFAEEVRRNKSNKNILEVKCTYCGKWHIPKTTKVRNRIDGLNGKVNSEHRFYCSNECKKECPIYKKIKYSSEETNTKKLSREVQPELRKMVFERDDWICQKCESTKSLHCHHVEGIRWEPLESADIDKCITLCKKCHKKAHQKENCKTSDMKCK
jgi:hypothetical protein